MKRLIWQLYNTFWSAFGVAFHIDAPDYFKKVDVKSVDDFLLKLKKNNWDNRVIIFIDEYDVLYEADDDVKASFLGVVIHGIKNAKI